MENIICENVCPNKCVGVEIYKQQLKEELDKRINYFIKWRNDGRCGNDKIEITKNLTSVIILKELKRLILK